MKGDNSKFTWGDSVIIIKNAPNKFHPGKFASVCGFYKVQAKETARELDCEVGDWIYTVEFEDGSDIQIPEHYLNKDFTVIHGSELSKYNKSFINGELLNVVININWIELEVKSFPINQLNPENIPFLNDGFLIGKIIITQIENFTLNNSSFSLGPKRKGRILTFEISDHKLNLLIEWDRAKTTSFEIRSGQIWWKQKST